MMQDASIQNLPSTYIDPTTELQSYFARVILNYASKYYLTATFRADGSSKFGENNRYGHFPSVAGKWLISNENFMKNSTLFSNLAIRASWGKTGNQEFPAGASRSNLAFHLLTLPGRSMLQTPI
jgi:iron complex outermembrane receptor protein